MPAADRVLTLLHQAVALTRAVPGRRGHVLRLHDGADVVVAGDLHGHVANSQAVLAAADLANHPHRHLVLQEIVHGPYRHPGGGDRSHQLVDLFAALKCRFPNRVHLLPGNHELAQWTGRKVLKAELDQNALFEQGVRTAYGLEWGPRIYAAYLDLFRTSPLAIHLLNRVLLTHSLPPARALEGFDPRRLEREEFEAADLQPGGNVHSLVWGRDTSAAAAAGFLAAMDADLLVTGHVPTDDGYEVPNGRQLIVDSADRPAAFAVIPADRPITHAELVAAVRVIGPDTDDLL